VNNPLLLGFSAGLGGAIGELTTYYCGLGIKEALEKDEDDDFSKWVRKYGFIAIFIVAASPLPDTPIALLFGSSRFPFKKFLVIEIVGKTLYYSLGAALGGLFFAEIGNVIGETFLSIIIFGGSTLLVILTSWKKTRDRIFTFLRRFLP
jgi:membrane protein YqaA with SNARE-associated domain